jgi:hypothetical protein
MRFAGDRMRKPASQGGTKGTFRAQATKHGMTPLQYAKEVLAHKDQHSPKMRMKANFVRNANTWRKG